MTSQDGAMKDPGERSQRIELKIPSQLLYLGVPDAILMELAGDLPCDQKDIDEISTSVIEACTNAMEHGNGMDEQRQVEIHFDIAKDEIAITVLDHGPGFDHKGWIPPEDLLRERGRGITIMREFTDELDFDFAADGRFRVCLRKHLQRRE
ncbi:ATP-binding protein [bacterium]|nr:ATP-binding protein [bacterium]MBU1072773.1 ATP-binding protein [bacterium]MBU1675056.1 ATP-binding protein [bacterium]